MKSSVVSRSLFPGSVIWHKYFYRVRFIFLAECLLWKLTGLPECRCKHTYVNWSMCLQLVQSSMCWHRAGTKAHFTDFLSKFFSKENVFWCKSVIRHHITKNFCEVHDSTTVVPCATFCNDHVSTLWMTIRWNVHWIWLRSHYYNINLQVSLL